MTDIIVFLSLQTGGGLAVGTVLLIGNTLTCNKQATETPSKQKGHIKWIKYFLTVMNPLLKLAVWALHKTVRYQLSQLSQLLVRLCCYPH